MPPAQISKPDHQYPGWFRSLILNGDISGRAVDATKRSQDRWKKRDREGLGIGPKKHTGGKGPQLSGFGAFLIWWYLTVFTVGDWRTLNEFVFLFAAENITQTQYSREVERLGLSRKQITRASASRCPLSRCLFWINGPLEGAHAWGLPGVRGWKNVAGVMGVDPTRLIDLDEMGIYGLAQSQPKHGYAPVGERAELELPFSTKSGVKCSLIAAVDINIGVVAYWAAPMASIDRDAFMLFVVMCLLPAIRGQNRVLMMDNLGAHYCPELDAMFAAEGHLLLYRPVHSPDFGPIEYCFGWLRQTMEALYDHMTEDNWRSVMIHALLQLSPDTVAEFFADCHYCIPGKPYKPYVLGGQ